MNENFLATIPSYALATQSDRAMNADALIGISTGYPASIRIKASKFRVVDGNGNEQILKPSELASGEFLPVVVLATRRGLNKVYYASAYDPNQAEASAPDCFSLDGDKPDASVKTAQCTNCATCPKNAFGSGRNQAGMPTKGKACADNKTIAVLYKGGVYQFKIPPASLKNWGLFVKKLDSHEVSIGAVITYIGFDENADYSVLTFAAAGFVKQEQMEAIARFRSSQEVREITNYMPSTSTPTPATQIAAPVAAHTKPVEVKAEPVAVPVDDIFGGDASAPVEVVAPKRGPRAVKKDEVVEAVPVEAKDSSVMSDDDIANMLGIN